MFMLDTNIRIYIRRDHPPDNKGTPTLFYGLA